MTKKQLDRIPSARTLEGIPARAFTFALGVAQSVPARSALATKGFDNDEHAYAWARLQALGEFGLGLPQIDAQVRDAVVELDAWDEPNFEAIRNALLRDHVEQATFLFDNLEATQGAEAVLGVERLLDRLDLLESGDGREATRDKDLAAIALLAKRGYTRQERHRLRRLVTLTRSVAPAPKLTDQARQQLLVELYRWLADWSSQARQCITARSTLIRLGLAKRRRSRRDQIDEAPDEISDLDEDDDSDAEPATTRTAEPTATRTAEPTATRTAEPTATGAAELTDELVDEDNEKTDPGDAKGQRAEISGVQ